MSREKFDKKLEAFNHALMVEVHKEFPGATLTEDEVGLGGIHCRITFAESRVGAGFHARQINTLMWVEVDGIHTTSKKRLAGHTWREEPNKPINPKSVATMLIRFLKAKLEDIPVRKQKLQQAKAKEAAFDAMCELRKKLEAEWERIDVKLPRNVILRTEHDGVTISFKSSDETLLRSVLSTMVRHTHR